MSPKVPSSDDIINFLIDLGFDVEDETDDFMVLTDEEFTVKIPFSLSDKDTEKIRGQLKKIMDEYGDDVFSRDEYDEDDDGYDEEGGEDDDEYEIDELDEDDETAKKIQDWLNEPA